MLTKIQKPQTKQDLIRAINQANIKSISVFEGDDLKNIKKEMTNPRLGYTAIFLK